MDGHTETIRSLHTDNYKNLLTHSINLTCKANDASGHPDSVNETGITVLFTVCCIIIIIIIIFILFRKSNHKYVS